ncbi:MAG: NAD-dependent epimerase/dehydratase family protein [Lewinellaceae bacterium]|nr:NAD-dependent epimerase/dehydratase family protein [Lewinellaceae bacterium]
MTKDTILITGANGQIGSVLTEALRQRFGEDNVIPTDIRKLDHHVGHFEFLNVLEADHIAELIDRHQVTQIYHLAAILSAKGEQAPLPTWDINMKGLLNILEVAREKKIAKVFNPSSIAVFGTTTPRVNTPQFTVMEPTTVYGISKVAGELWCQYFHTRYGLDVRSVRYPGIIGYQSLPGGGTTDYAVDIYHKAILGQPYECFLKEDTRLPMLYMDDAIRGTLELMDAPADRISIRTSYNLSAMSFTPAEISLEIRKHIPDFKVSYQPDFRQAIADSWTQSIDDSHARRDWGWVPKYDLVSMTEDMLVHLAEQYAVEKVEKLKS